MTTTVIDHIGMLVTNDPAVGDGALGLVHDAALVIENGVVVTVAPQGAAADARIDAGGCCVVPGFVDSHTHLVFAGDRAEEFTARMAGRPYEAGGIRTTTMATRNADDGLLRQLMAQRLAEARAGGTTHVEIKSGYSLDVDGEARLCRLAFEATDDVTFLGAHVAPAEYDDRLDDYVALVTGPMLDACAPWCRWVDAFCERGAFDVDQCREILQAGQARGLGGRLHANQLGLGPGVRLAVELGAASADHCTYLAAADVEALAGGTTVATLLPASDFSTRQPYPDARRLLDAGVTVALASNCNPGSSYTTSMAFCIALAVREMHMTAEEALWSATAGGAAALRRSDLGRLSTGSAATAVLLDAPSYHHLAYRPGMPLVSAVIAP